VLHAAAAAARADCPPFAGKRDETLEGARGAAKSCKASPECSAADELPELSFDEKRQGRAAACGSGGGEERLQVRANDLVEDAAGG
jgi:hypothetical protein